MSCGNSSCAATSVAAWHRCWPICGPSTMFIKCKQSEIRLVNFCIQRQEMCAGLASRLLPAACCLPPPSSPVAAAAHSTWLCCISSTQFSRLCETVFSPIENNLAWAVAREVEKGGAISGCLRISHTNTA